MQVQSEQLAKNQKVSETYKVMNNDVSNVCCCRVLKTSS